jgi:hypothetical protein
MDSRGPLAVWKIFKSGARCEARALGPTRGACFNILKYAIRALHVQTYKGADWRLNLVIKDYGSSQHLKCCTCTILHPQVCTRNRPAPMRYCMTSEEEWPRHCDKCCEMRLDAAQLPTFLATGENHLPITPFNVPIAERCILAFKL